ncbi:MAG: hypothetical protein H7Y59_11475 [Anaerolineales bacterium]|nr:hypothetical protein [Anaerolineales bacterium]
MDSIETAINQIESLKRVLKKGSSIQVRSQEEKSLIKATALSWFMSLRPELKLDDSILLNVNEIYKFLLEACEKSTSREVYFPKLKAVREGLIKVRADNILSYEALSSKNDVSDNAPNFDLLIKDPKMIAILISRWDECIKCIKADAPLSATVMMGGMLEAILLAKINSLSDKTKVINSASAPIDKKTSKVLPLQEWTLRNYIDVAHEIGWVTQTAKDVGEVLRDYRNYIHPYKELSHGIKLVRGDAELFWNITKSIINKILLSGKI